MSTKETKELKKVLIDKMPKKAVVSTITESTAQELAKQFKRVADLMERQQKIDLLTGTRDKIKEAINSRKNDALPNSGN